MTDLTTVIALSEQLTPQERLQLLEYLATTLRRAWPTPPHALPWAEFIDQTAGSLADDPIQRWPQGDYETREPLE